MSHAFKRSLLLRQVEAESMSVGLLSASKSLHNLKALVSGSSGHGDSDTESRGGSPMLFNGSPSSLRPFPETRTLPRRRRQQEERRVSSSSSLGNLTEALGIPPSLSAPTPFSRSKDQAKISSGELIDRSGYTLISLDLYF